MKFIYFVIFLKSTILFGQQSTDINFFKNLDFDNVKLTVFSIKSKTSSAPSFNLEENTTEVKKIKKEKKLSEKEICKLFKHIKKVENKHVLDSDYDINIAFFENNKLIQEIDISSFSKNIKLKKANCKKTLSDGYEIDPCLFLGSMTSKQEKFISKLLKN